jgi:hypothetical protein
MRIYAILIDAEHCTVTAVPMDDSADLLKQCRALLRCEHIDGPIPLPGGDVQWVDDDGWLHSYERPYAGNILITGVRWEHRDGHARTQLANARLTVEQVMATVAWSDTPVPPHAYLTHDADAAPVTLGDTLQPERHHLVHRQHN